MARSLLALVALVALVALAGCDDRLRVDEIDFAQRSCAERGGLRWVDSEWMTGRTFRVTAFCVDGVEVTGRVEVRR